MKLTQEQYDRIADAFPTQRGNVSLDHLTVMNAILYALENGCKWRALPAEFGNWHTLYTRMSRWAKAGVLNRIFVRLQEEAMLYVRIDAMSLDSTSVRVHPDACGALKKTARKPSGGHGADKPQRYIWLPQLLVRQ